MEVPLKILIQNCSASGLKNLITTAQLIRYEKYLQTEKARPFLSTPITLIYTLKGIFRFLLYVTYNRINANIPWQALPAAIKIRHQVRPFFEQLKCWKIVFLLQVCTALDYCRSLICNSAETTRWLGSVIDCFIKTTHVYT